MDGKAKAEKLAENAKGLANEAKSSRWFSPVARLGYVVRGVLYALVGSLAVALIFTGRGDITDTRGALAAIAAQPYGKILLIIIAVGLAGLALWMLILAVADPYHKGKDASGKLSRAGYLVTAASYLGLIFLVLRLLSGGWASQEVAITENAQKAAAGVFQVPGGPWLVGVVGIVFIVIGVVQMKNGLKGDLDEQFRIFKLNSTRKRWVKRLGRVGLAARGMVIMTVGSLALLAALTLDPNRVGGIDAALLFLAQQPYGPWLLAFVSFGLIAYAAFLILGAVWFKIRDL